MKKLNLLYRESFILLLILVVLGSCKKEYVEQTVSVKKAKTQDDNYFFNWETVTSMPVSPNSTVQVPLPWQSQSGSYIDASLVSDYKNSDGWDLVYNTFNPTVLPYANTLPPGGLYFALYNRYRGLFRFYLYIPSGLFGSSSHIEHGLAVYSDNGTTSRMLNFDGVDIVDPSLRTTAFTKTNNTGVAVGGGWYAMQYQIGYDPDFAATQYPHLGFTWNSRTTSISQIVISGTQQGTISGSITQKSSGFPWASTLINGILAAAEIYGTAGGFTGSEASNWTSAASGGLAGSVTGLFSGIFGGNSNNTSEVDLTMNTTISLAGSITSSQPLVPNSLVVPGQTLGNTVGAPNPLQSYRLGLFNLNARPNVNVHTTVTTVSVPFDPGVPYNQFTNEYSVDASSFNSQIIFNPDVINNSPTGASIQNLQTRVDLLNPFPGSGLFNSNASPQTIGSYTVYESLNLVTQYTVEHQQPNNTQVAIKVSFNVVPNSGGPSVFIVKTFMANLVHI